jgi:hypothetical protein
MAAEIEQGDLTDLLGGAFGGDQTEREIRFVGRFIPRCDFTDEHAPNVGVAPSEAKGLHTIMALHRRSENYVATINNLTIFVT